MIAYRYCQEAAQRAARPVPDFRSVQDELRAELRAHRLRADWLEAELRRRDFEAARRAVLHRADPALAKLRRETPFAQLVRDASAAFGVSAKDILGPKRIRKVAWARFAVIWVARRELGHSLLRIAGRLNRDHSTIMHGERAAARLRAEDAEFRMLSDALVALYRRPQASEVQDAG